MSTALDLSTSHSAPHAATTHTLNSDPHRHSGRRDLLSTPVPLNQPPPLLTSSSEESPGPLDPRLGSLSGPGYKESDSESGFEDGSSSQLSRSLGEDGQRAGKDGDGTSEGAEEADRRGSTAAVDSVRPDQVLLEMSSVALDWRSPRAVENCDCAMPFEFHTKQVSLCGRSGPKNLRYIRNKS